MVQGENTTIDTLIDKLKVQIIEQLNLEDVSPEDIDAEAPLFESELGLDSIDALEIIVLLERDYGLKIDPQEDGKKIFRTIRTIAEFITEKKG
jgi:acyl carrier protein